MPQTPQNKIGVLFPNPDDPVFDYLWPLGNRPASSAWKIAKAIQYGSKLAMYPVYPRPTGEVGASAPHLWAHSTMPYVVKPGVLGGCWPFRWSIVSGPSGLTVGSELARQSVDGLVLHTVDAAYQKFTLPGAKSGMLSFSLRCTDQLDNTVDFNYSATVDDSRFVFVDSSAVNDSGSGAIGSPKKIFSSVWNATNAGKIIVLRAGTHQLIDLADSTAVGFASNRPIAIMAYPGEVVNVDMSTRLFRDGGAANTANDVLLRDLNLINIRTGDANTHAILFNGAQKRVTLDNLSFDRLHSGTVGDNNQSAIAFLDGGAAHENLFCVDCELTSDTEISLWVNFNTQKMLLERPYGSGITQAASNGAGFFNVKDKTDYCTVRGAYFNGSTAGAGVGKISNQASPGSNQEHCWYTYIANGATGMYWNQQRFQAGGGPLYDYAGSLKVTGALAFTAAKWAPANVNVLTEGLAIYGEWGNFDLDGYTTGAVANQSLSAAQLDASGLLTGTGTTHRLTKGSELWSSP
jgi:hypothetical protein